MRNINQKIIGLIMIVLALTLLSSTVMAEENKDNVYYQGNNMIQDYVAEDGSVHTIYWVSGVKAPLMSSDPQLLATDGYFNKYIDGDENKITNVTYEAAVEIGKGYYDFNKSLPFEKTMCYLATSANMIHWWLEQNAEYIQFYQEGIQTGRFKQMSPLQDLTLVNWDALISQGRLVERNKLNQQILNDSELVKTAFKNNYYVYDDGYWMDPVIDFFINGYLPFQVEAHSNMIPPENNPGIYKPAPNGGYFYPIFGMETITQRHSRVDFAYYNDNIKDWILNDNVVALSYLVNNSVAHAITVWGAEYDANDELIRLYVTDSDDFGNSVEHSNNARGLHSMNVRDVNGLLHIGNNEGPLAGAGNVLQEMATLNLATDIWERVINDTHPEPLAPMITVQPQDRVYALSATANELHIEAELVGNDLLTNAKLSYQWYKSDSEDGIGEKIKDATSSSYRPLIADKEATNYYYCVISSNKYGNSTSVKSRYAKIESKDLAIVNATMPDVDFNTSRQKMFVGDEIKLEIKVNNLDALTSVSYQWYETNNNTTMDWVRKIENATEATFTFKAEDTRSRFFYCVITNEDNSETITGQTLVSYQTRPKYITIYEYGNQEQVNVDFKLSLDELHPNDIVTVEFIDSDGSTNNYFEVSGAAEKINEQQFKVLNAAEIQINAYFGGDEYFKPKQITKNYQASLNKGPKPPIIKGEYKVSPNNPNYFMYELNQLENAEYSADNGQTWQDSNVFDLIEPLTTKTFTARYKANSTQAASANAEAIVLRFEKLDNDAIATLKYRKEKSADDKLYIVIEAIENAEYSFDGGLTYSDINYQEVTSDLTEITLALRYKASPTLKASNPTIKNLNFDVMHEQEALVFETIGDKEYNSPDFILNVKGGSGLGEIVFTSSNLDVLEIEGKLAKIKAAGQVEITATKAADDNYYAQTTTVKLDIKKSDLIINIEDLTIYAGEELPKTFAYTIYGLKENDNIENLSFKHNGLDNKVPGEYLIELDEMIAPSLNLNNYELIINPAMLTIKALEQLPIVKPTPVVKPEINQNPEPEIVPEIIETVKPNFEIETNKESDIIENKDEQIDEENVQESLVDKEVLEETNKQNRDTSKTTNDNQFFTIVILVLTGFLAIFIALHYRNKQ